MLEILAVTLGIICAFFKALVCLDFLAIISTIAGYLISCKSAYNFIASRQKASYKLTSGLPVSSLRKTLKKYLGLELDSEEERDDAPAVRENEAVSADEDVPGEGLLSPMPKSVEASSSVPLTPVVDFETIQLATDTDNDICCHVSIA